MLDAYQATTIAYEIEGVIAHQDCIQDQLNDLWVQAQGIAQHNGVEGKYSPYVERIFLELRDEAGISPLSRYDIHEQTIAERQDLVDWIMQDPGFWFETHPGAKDEMLEYITSNRDRSFVLDMDEWIYNWLRDNGMGGVLCDICEGVIE